MRWIVLVLLVVGFAPLDIGLTGLVSAVDVDFDCPDEIFAGEEFECSLEVFDGDGDYDVKVDLDGERDSVLEIWDEEENEWLSGYYYLKEFIENDGEEDVRLVVLEDGNYDGVLKLRQGDRRELFDFELDVEEVVVFEEVVVSPVGSEQLVVSSEKRAEVILLNGDVIDEVEEVVYESKNFFVGSYLIYGFCLFLIFVIFVLVWERRN